MDKPRVSHGESHGSHEKGDVISHKEQAERLEGVIQDVITQGNPTIVSLRTRALLATISSGKSTGMDKTEEKAFLDKVVNGLRVYIENGKKLSFTRSSDAAIRNARVAELTAHPDKLVYVTNETLKFIMSPDKPFDSRITPPGTNKNADPLRLAAINEFNKRIKELKDNKIDTFSAVAADDGYLLGRGESEVRIVRVSGTKRYKIERKNLFGNQKLKGKEYVGDLALEDALRKAWSYVKVKDKNLYDADSVADRATEESDAAQETEGEHPPAGRTAPLTPVPHAAAGGGHAAHEGGSHPEVSPSSPHFNEDEVNRLIESGGPNTEKARELVLDNAIRSGFDRLGLDVSNPAGLKDAKRMVNKWGVKSWFGRMFINGLVSATVAGIASLTAYAALTTIGPLIAAGVLTKIAAGAGIGFGAGMLGRFSANWGLNKMYGKNTTWRDAVPIFRYKRREREKGSVTFDEVSEIAAGKNRVSLDFSRQLSLIRREKLRASKLGGIKIKDGYNYKGITNVEAEAAFEKGAKHERWRRVAANVIGGLAGGLGAYELRTGGWQHGIGQGNVGKFIKNPGAYLPAFSPSAPRTTPPVHGGSGGPPGGAPRLRAAPALTTAGGELPPRMTGARCMYDVYCEPRVVRYVHVLDAPPVSSGSRADVLTFTGRSSGAGLFNGFPNTNTYVDSPYSGLEQLMSRVRGVNPDLLNFGPVRGSSPLTSLFRDTISADPTGDLRNTFLNIGNPSRGRWVDYAVMNEYFTPRGYTRPVRMIDYMIDNVGRYGDSSQRANMRMVLENVRSSLDSGSLNNANLSARLRR